MKHLFTVHSPITFLAAYGVIENLKLNRNDVVIYSLSYKVPLKSFKVFPFFSTIHKSWFSKLIVLNTPVNEDKYISKITEGEDFIAYIDLMSHHQRTIVTHNKCVGFNFIEEGNANYRSIDTIDDLTFDKRHYSYRITSKSMLVELLTAIKWTFRGYNQRHFSIPFSFTSYASFEKVIFFGFSNKAFPTVSTENKYILAIPQSDEINQMAGNMSLNDCVIWIDGANSSFTGLPDEIYHRAIEKAIEKMKLHLADKAIYVKLRPGSGEGKSNYLYSILKAKDYNVVIMPNDLILECVFINSKNCTVIGNLTSALFYASIFGHKSYSIYSLYEVHVQTYFDQMPGFWSKVTKL